VEGEKQVGVLLLNKRFIFTVLEIIFSGILRALKPMSITSSNSSNGRRMWRNDGQLCGTKPRLKKWRPTVKRRRSNARWRRRGEKKVFNLEKKTSKNYFP
jgi:hypothetical protein